MQPALLRTVDFSDLNSSHYSPIDVGKSREMTVCIWRRPVCPQRWCCYAHPVFTTTAMVGCHRTNTATRAFSAVSVGAVSQKPPVWVRGVCCPRIDPLRFLAGCRRRRLNQGLVVALGFFSLLDGACFCVVEWDVKPCSSLLPKTVCVLVTRWSAFSKPHSHCPHQLAHS